MVLAGLLFGITLSYPPLFLVKLGSLRSNLWASCCFPRDTNIPTAPNVNVSPKCQHAQRVFFWDTVVFKMFGVLSRVDFLRANRRQNWPPGPQTLLTLGVISFWYRTWNKVKRGLGKVTFLSCNSMNPPASKATVRAGKERVLGPEPENYFFHPGPTELVQTETKIPVVPQMSRCWIVIWWELENKGD